MDFKIEITGKTEGEDYSVNLIDIFEGDKSNGLRFMLAYRELVNYIHTFMPNMSKQTMIDVIDEIFNQEVDLSEIELIDNEEDS